MTLKTYGCLSKFWSPFWLLNIIRHLVLGNQKGTRILDNHPYTLSRLYSKLAAGHIFLQFIWSSRPWLGEPNLCFIGLTAVGVMQGFPYIYIYMYMDTTPMIHMRLSSYIVNTIFCMELCLVRNRKHCDLRYFCSSDYIVIVPAMFWSCLRDHRN